MCAWGHTQSFSREFFNSDWFVIFISVWWLCANKQHNERQKDSSTDFMVSSHLFQFTFSLISLQIQRREKAPNKIPSIFFPMIRYSNARCVQIVLMQMHIPFACWLAWQWRSMDQRWEKEKKTTMAFCDSNSLGNEIHARHHDTNTHSKPKRHEWTKKSKANENVTCLVCSCL